MLKICRSSLEPQR